MNKMHSAWRSQYFALFMLVAFSLWFARDMVWGTIYFPYNWGVFIFVSFALIGGLWSIRFSAWALPFLAFIGILLDPRILVQFFASEEIKFFYFYLNFFLSMLDVAWVSLALSCALSMRFDTAAKWLISALLSTLLIAMIWLPHYRWT